VKEFEHTSNSFASVPKATEFSRSPTLTLRLAPDIVIGHIRLATDSKSTYENTHPFLYQNQLFLQNGYIANFAEHKNELVKCVDASLLKHVKGDTDTELLFFMFLTIKKRREKNHKTVTSLQETKILVESIRELFRIFEDKNIEISANLIYAEERYIVITRYITYDKSKYKKEQIPPSLYYDTKDGLLITSEPITPHFTIVPVNTIMIIDSEKSKMIIMDV
jgi:predicted glutamine amidotransferase